MADDKVLQELIERALADEEFRARLLDDLQQATIEAGYHLTPRQLAQLKATDLQAIAEALDARSVIRPESD